MWDIFSIERCQIQLMGNNSSFFKVRFEREVFSFIPSTRSPLKLLNI